MQNALRPGMQQDPSKGPAGQQAQSVQDHADQVLQQQLLAAQYDTTQNVPHPPRPQPGVPTHIQPAPRDHSANIDPAISGAAPPPGGMIPAPSDMAGGDANQQHQHQQHQQAAAQQAVQQGQQVPQVPQGQAQPETPEARKTYGKRELSSSKRAAQNRAAQRAFRQRKEGYIRKLEEQVKEHEHYSEALKALQAENYQLREYIITLQNRLVETQNEVPDMPQGLDLSQQRTNPAATGGAGAGLGAAGNAPGSDQPEQLDALNRIAVAGLGMRRHQHEEAAYLGGGNAGNAGSANANANAGGGANNRGRAEGDETGEAADTSEVHKTDLDAMQGLASS